VTVGEALLVTSRTLREAGSPTPRLDAELLLGHVLGRERAWILAHPESPVEDEAAFVGLVERRAAGEPVAYLRGFKEWHGLRLRTDRRALIPRPETELIADAASAEIEVRLRSGPVLAWDVGTGSGALAIALALHLREATGRERLSLMASDVSPDALALAAANAADHGVADVIEFLAADLLDAIDGRPRPDVIVANLPYVPTADVDAGHGSLGFEPRIALDGGRDGLEVVGRFLEGLPTSAAPGATAFLEIGADQAAAVRRLAPPGASVDVIPDLAGRDRVLRIDMPTLAR
jgi:release factor glutamine methyltransferase